MRKFEKISFKQFEKDFNGKENIEKTYNDLELPKRGHGKRCRIRFLFPL